MGGRGQGLVSLFRDLKGEIKKVNWPTPRQAGNMTAVIIALSAGLGLWLMQGWLSLLPIAASCIGTFALFFLDGLRMRALMLVGTLLWLANNLLVGSIGGSALEAVLAATNAHTIWRMARSR